VSNLTSIAAGVDSFPLYSSVSSAAGHTAWPGYNNLICCNCPGLETSLEFLSHFFQTLADFCPTKATERRTQGGKERYKMAKGIRETVTSYNS